MATTEAAEPSPPGRRAERTVVQVFADDVVRLADRPALRRRVGEAWEAISWADYGRAVREVTAGLAELGIGRGDRVAILSANCPEWHMVDLGIMAGGAVSVPIYATSAPSQVAYILEHSESRVCFAGDAEQLTKVLEARDRPAGLACLERAVLLEGPVPADDAFVISLTRLRELGQARLRREPTLVDELSATVGSDDLATLVYTSGTTGPAKGAMITHANITSTGDALLELIGPQPDRFLSFLPLSHITERMLSHFLQIMEGAETWFARSLSTVAEDLPECRPTILFAVPRVWQKLHVGLEERLREEKGVPGLLARRWLSLGGAKMAAAEEGRGMSLLDRVQYEVLDRVVGAKVRARLGLDQARVLACGAAPVHPDVLRFFHGLGLEVAEGYGQTEVCLCTTWSPAREARIGSVGRPIPGVGVKIADDGEILVSGGGLCLGYYRDEPGTRELIDAEGWLHSGDVGRLDDDGYLYVTDRKKDLIVTAAGKNVAPQELETRFRLEPLISQAVVVGEGRPYLVVLLTLDPDALHAWTAERSKPADLEALLADPDLEAEIAASVARVNASFSRAETVKRWRVLPRDFTIADGEMTPTLKVKRRAVGERYADVIDELYAP